MLHISLSAVVTSFTEKHPLYLVIYGDGKKDEQDITSFPDFLSKLKAIKEGLSKPGKKKYDFFMPFTLGKIPWYNDKVGEQMGRAMANLLDRPYIKMGSGTDHEMLIQIRPLLEEVRPALKELQIGLLETRVLEGSSVEKVDLTCDHPAPMNWYLPSLLRIHSTDYFMEKTVSIIQFYKSRLPRQPKCRTLSCSAQMDFEIPPNFYLNIFYEISEAFSKIRRLTVNCQHRHIEDFNSASKHITSHITQFAKFAIIHSILYVEIVDRDEDFLQEIRNTIYKILSAENSSNLRIVKKNRTILYTDNKAKCLINFNHQRPIAGWYMTDDEEDYNYNFEASDND